MFNNKKGQISATIMIMGFIVLALLVVSSSYISSLGMRGINQTNNRQLQELTEGAVFYSMAHLRNNIDYISDPLNTNPDDALKYKNIKVGDKDVEFSSKISILNETDPLYNSVQKINIHEVGESQVIDLNINNASDVCFEVTWDPDPATGNHSPVTFEVEKVTSQSESNAIKVPITESDGRIGEDPAICTDSNIAKISEDSIYNKNSNIINNGYGHYRVKVTANGPAPNLQTNGLYNRLSYRTFKITSEAKFGDLVKNNTETVIKASYPNYDTDNPIDANNIIPKFEIIKWSEGDE